MWGWAGPRAASQSCAGALPAESPHPHLEWESCSSRHSASTSEPGDPSGTPAGGATALGLHTHLLRVFLLQPPDFLGAALPHPALRPGVHGADLCPGLELDPLPVPGQ